MEGSESSGQEQAMTVMAIPQELFALLAAELCFVAVRRADILVAMKSEIERTRLERRSIRRGLRRSLVLECLLFIPASTLLLILTAPLLTKKFHVNGIALYSVIGLASYQFPFRVVQGAIVKTALQLIRAAIDDTVEEKAERVKAGVER